MKINLRKASALARKNKADEVTHIPTDSILKVFYE